MKGEKVIIGKTIVRVEGFGGPGDEYLTAYLNDGSHIEITDIQVARKANKENKR